MIEVALSVILYLGLITTLAGLVSLAIPLRFVRIRTRARAFRVVIAGMVLVAAALAVPAVESHATTSASRLDELHPRWQFHEFHQTYVAAPPSVVYRAVKDTTASEILLFQTLTAIRRFGQPGPESILHAPEQLPLLDVATRSGFRWLADDPAREIVVGTLVAGERARLPANGQDYIALDAVPGLAKATMNFHISANGAGTRLTTETRVYATDAASRRRFAAYWRLIYPGSSIIRYAWLRAIRHRAEAMPPPGSS